MYGRRTYIVPISGLVGAVLVIALILSGKIVAAAGIAFPAAVIVFPLSYVFGDLLSEVYGYASTQRVVWGDFAA